MIFFIHIVLFENFFFHIMAPQVKVSGYATNMGVNVMVELTGLSNGQVNCAFGFYPMMF